MRPSYLHLSAALAVSLTITTGVLPVPDVAAEHPKYMGVASCSSSNCHGSVSPRKATNVLQNEYSTWSKHDAHSNAWISLTNEQSKTIAKHLGIEDATQEPACLACHATYVSDAKRHGEKFRLEDGVSCESCHGAAENYLQPHADTNATTARNRELGMIPLENPITRAALCLDCHHGSEGREVDHRLIGAGHPRLTFELDTFSALMPAHWEVDDDYKTRKGDYEPARAWLLGQIERSRALIEAMEDPERARAGEGFLASPELSLLYCFSCHHSLSEGQYKVRDYSGAPGELRTNLSSLVIVNEVLRVMAEGERKGFESALGALHRGNGSAEVFSSTRKTLDTLERRAKSETIPAGKLLSAITALGAAQNHLPYEVAEQIAMGVSSLLQHDESLKRSLSRAVDALYTALATPFEFKAEDFTEASRQLAAQLPKER